MESLKLCIFSGVLLLKNKRPSVENKDRKGVTELENKNFSGAPFYLLDGVLPDS